MNDIKAIKYYLYVSLLLGGLWLGLSYSINHPYLLHLAKSYLRDKVKDETGFLFNFQKVNLSLLPLRADVIGLELFDKTGHTRFLVPSITVDLSVFSLIMGKPRVSLLQLNNPSLIVLDQKKTRTIAPKKKSTRGTEIDFAEMGIDKIRVHQGTFLYASDLFTKQVLPTFHIEKRGIDAALNVTKRGDVDIQLDVRSLGVWEKSKSLLEKTNVHLEAQIRGSEIISKKIEIKGSDIDAIGQIKGKIDYRKGTKLASGIELTLPFNIRTELSILGTYLDLEQTSGGVESSFTMNTYIKLPGGQRRGRFKITGQGKLHNGVLSSYKLFDTRLDYIITSRGMTFKKVELIDKTRKFGQGSGYIEFDKIDYDFVVNLDQYALSDILNLIDVPYDGGIDFDITSEKMLIKGAGKPFWMAIKSFSTLDSFKIQDVEGLHQDKAPSCEFDINLSIDENKLMFKEPTKGQCALKSKPPTKSDERESEVLSYLSIDGQIDFDEGMQMGVSGEPFSFDMLSYLLPVDAKGEGSVNFSLRTLDKKTVSQIEFFNDDLLFFDFPLKKTKGKLEFSDKIIKLIEIFPYLDQGKSLMTGSVDLNTSTFHLNSTIRHVESPFFDAFFAKNLQKDIRFNLKELQMDVEGSLKKPLTATGKIAFHLIDLYYGEEKILDYLNFSGMRDHKKLISDKCLLGFSTLDFECSANLLFDSSKESKRFFKEEWDIRYSDFLSITIKNTGESKEEVDLNKIPYLKKYISSLDAKGHLFLNGKLEGTFSRLDGQVQGAISKLTILEDIQIPQFDFQMMLINNKLDLGISQAGGGLRASYRTTLDKPKNKYNVYLNLNQFDARLFNVYNLASDPRNYIYLSGELSLEGYHKESSSSKGHVLLENLSVNYVYDKRGLNRHFELQNKQAVKLQIGEGKKDKNGDENLILVGDGFYAKIFFDEMALPNKINTKIIGDLDLEIFQFFFPRVDSSTGLIGFVFNLDGSIDKPNYYLNIKNKVVDRHNLVVKPVTLSLPKIKPYFRNILFDIDYQNGLLTINQLFGEKGKGFFDIKGDLVVDHKQSTSKSNVTVEINNTNVFYQFPILKHVDASLTGHLNITQNKAPYLVSGSLDVEATSSNRRFNFSQEIFQSILGSRHTNKGSGFLFDNAYAEFDIGLLGEKSIKINNKTMNLIGTSSLKLMGDSSHPKLIGSFSAEGDFYYKRRFYLSHCEINFDESSLNDPFVEIDAYTEVMPYKVSVKVSGRASTAKVALTIDPSISEDGLISEIQILYLISHGVLPPATTFSSDSYYAGMTEAVNLILQQLPFEKILDIFEQELFVFYPDLITNTRGEPEVQLNISATIYNQIRALLKTTRDKRSVTLDLPLNRHISVTGEQAYYSDEKADKKTQTETGFDVRFRFPF